MARSAPPTKPVMHTNRGRNGAWTQRYEHGIPVTGLVPIDDDDTSGTTVPFLPGEALRAAAAVTEADLRQLTISPDLSVEVIDQRIR